MTGNICRCSNYNRYVEAVLAASAAGSGATPKRGSGRSAQPAMPIAAVSATKNRRGTTIAAASAGGER
jgi:xanthine dehydrogenase iron-sulfur cluster and FAD-binding subunit A